LTFLALLAVIYTITSRAQRPNVFCRFIQGSVDEDVPAALTLFSVGLLPAG
jgi:hypothetical protein